jgi:hypothetical protein
MKLQNFQFWSPIKDQLKAEEVLLAILLAAWVMGVVTTIMV